MEDKIPRVFISYSWSNSQHEEKVISLAERLMSQGVDVVLDKWDLKEGQDKYHFMEQAVTNTEIDRVLLICDKMYSEKADKRDGGVGDETTIISPELYKQVDQGKYIPVIFEVDEDNKPYCPTYVKSRIYIDLSSDENYETEYEKLIRNIHEKPFYKKPALGKKPEWLEAGTVDLSPIHDLIRQIGGSIHNQTKENALIKRFRDTYYEKISEYKITERRINGEMIVSKISEMKPIRDIYIDFLEKLIINELSLVDAITSFFEDLYNIVLVGPSMGDSFSQNEFEHYYFLLWELFLCTVACLFHYDKFEEINHILHHTYFLRDNNSYKSNYSDKNFVYFKTQNFNLIEGDYKFKSNESRLHTYSGKLLCEREKKPIITKEALTSADILLCQLSFIFDIRDDSGIYWFPKSYIYNENRNTQWIKLKSKKYCKRILPLFGAESIENLKTLIKSHPVEKEYRYPGGASLEPSISNSINIDEIATLN